MAGLGWVFELEGLHLVLQDVGECQESAFLRLHISDVLCAGFFVLASKVLAQEAVIALLVSELAN